MFGLSVLCGSLRPWTAACQASLSFTVFQNSLKLMSIESVMPSNFLVLCRPLLLLPSFLPSVRVFSNELALHIRWPKYWSCASLYMLAHHLSTLFSTFKLHHCSYYSRVPPPFYDTMKFLSSCILGLCILYQELSTVWYTKLVRTVSHQRKNSKIKISLSILKPEEKSPGVRSKEEAQR